jgi:hypothetical protein
MDPNARSPSEVNNGSEKLWQECAFILPTSSYEDKRLQLCPKISSPCKFN